MKKPGLTYLLVVVINTIKKVSSYKLYPNAIIGITLLIILSLSAQAQITNGDVLKSNMDAQQDTVTLTIEEAEALLQQHNLLLIAQKYNIEQTRAQVLQSRLWDNPVLYAETNPYNQYSHKFFHFVNPNEASASKGIGNGINGSDFIWSIDQVIKTAGKRSNLVKLNTINTTIAEDVYYDLMRSLKFTLRADYYTMLQYQQGIVLLQQELNSLNGLINSVSIQVSKGTMALKDQLRLQALAFDVENNIRDFITQSTTAESEFKTIIGLPAKVKIIVVKDTAKLQPVTLPPLDTLANIALDNRYDLKVGNLQIVAAKTNLSLQRSLAYPDLDLRANYTRYSNFIPNYYGLGLTVQLPTWNRNQGNIKIAKYNISLQQVTYENQVKGAFNDLNASYTQFLKYQNVYVNFNKSFTQDYDVFLENVTKNYERHTIGLLEFIDFFESYRDTKISSYSLEEDFLEAKEQINYSVGKDIVK